MKRGIVTLKLRAPVPTAPVPTAGPKRSIHQACYALAMEADRQGVAHPPLGLLAADAVIRADLWYALDCPPCR